MWSGPSYCSRIAAPAVRASSQATRSSRSKRLNSEVIYFRFLTPRRNDATKTTLLCAVAPLREIFRSLSDRRDSLIDIVLSGAKVSDTRAQCKMAVHGRVRQVSATAFLHSLHDALVQLVQIGFTRALAQDVTKATDTQFDGRQQLEVI